MKLFLKKKDKDLYLCIGEIFVFFFEENRLIVEIRDEIEIFNYILFFKKVENVN